MLLRESLYLERSLRLKLSRLTRLDKNSMITREGELDGKKWKREELEGQRAFEVEGVM
jgi:hypothetical protein